MINESGAITVQMAARVDASHQLVIELPDDTPIGDVFIKVEIMCMPAQDELLAMRLAQRAPYLDAAAALLCADYETNPELTATSDTFDWIDEGDILDEKTP